CGLNPEGDLLAGSCGNGLIFVWNLRLIRQHLADKGLDWDLPSYPSADPLRTGTEPLRLEVPADDSELGWRPSPQEVEYYGARCKEAIEDVDRALNQGPETADLYCSRGRCHLFHRDAWLAVADLEKAVQLNPNHAVACATLALLYVNGPSEMR